MASDLREVTSSVGFSLPVYEMRLWVGLDVLWILFLPDSSDVAVHSYSAWLNGLATGQLSAVPTRTSHVELGLLLVSPESYD